MHISLPRIPLGFYPTPLHPLRRIGQMLGHPNLHLKRDDLLGIGLGGNKVRGLGYLLGDAQACRADTIITAGGPQSNLCSLVAAACAKLGLDCYLVHNCDAPRGEEEKGNLLLGKLLGAHRIWVGPVDEDRRAREVQTLSDSLRREGKRPYVIENGGSTPLGAVGYVEAAVELLAQHPVKHSVIVGAMGGTASGLVYGSALLGAPFHVHVISVEYPKDELLRRMSLLFQGLAQILGTPKVPPEDTMTIYDEFLGEGYGLPTTPSREARRLFAREEGVLLDNVYNAKTAAGFLHLVMSGAIGGEDPTALFHTGGSGAILAESLP